MVVAAIGPVVADEVRGVGVRVDVMPQKAYFMKPLVTELVRALQLNPD
jgi:uroporphyrinogen-III synthase